MTKKILILLVLGLVAALPTLAIADTNWTGAIDTSLINPGNWDLGLPHNEYYTEIANLKYVPATGTPPFPIIDSSVNVTWDCMVNESGEILMTGGSVHLLNYTSHLGLALWGMDWTTVEGNVPGLTPEEIDMFNSWGNLPGKLTMTGGSFTVDRVGLGYEIWGEEKAPGDPVSYEQYQTAGVRGDGTGILTIAGDAVFTVEPNTLGESDITGLSQLWIHTDSYIDIQDDGMLRVPLPFASIVDGYIADGKIIAGTPGDTLYNLTSGDEYVIFASDVPPIPGDADLDSDVDETDLTILASNWLGDTGMNWSTGDFNLDGVVNEEDASLLAANLGVGVPPAASVPEPYTLLLLCLGLGCVTLLRRK